jgi:hypothetical protein
MFREKPIGRNAALQALDNGIVLCKQFDTDIARDAARELLNKQSHFIKSLPSNVTDISIETNQEPTILPREELQEDYTRSETEAVTWTWDQVYAYNNSN